MTRRCFPLVLACASACTSPSPPPMAPPPTADIPVAEPEVALAEDAGGFDASTDAPLETNPAVRTSMELRAGLTPCHLVFHAGVGTRSDAGRYLMGIRRIEVEESESCAAHVVFDADSEASADPDSPVEALEGGLLPNPGKLEAARAEAEDIPVMLVDANFDGYLDLTAGEMSGAYNRSFRFWLFDPKLKRFTRSKELEELLMPRFDPKRKRIEAGGRAGGPHYVGSEHEWVGGKLETVWSESTTLGETPTGKPLPRGFSSWRVRYERRGSSMKKVYDGPAR